MHKISRYIQIRELELEIATDKIPTSNFLFVFRLNEWSWRQIRRLEKIIELKYLIIHDYEDLIKGEK